MFSVVKVACWCVGSHDLTCSNRLAVLRLCFGSFLCFAMVRVAFWWQGRSAVPVFAFQMGWALLIGSGYLITQIWFCPKSQFLNTRFSIALSFYQKKVSRSQFHSHLHRNPNHGVFPAPSLSFYYSGAVCHLCFTLYFRILSQGVLLLSFQYNLHPTLCFSSCCSLSFWFSRVMTESESIFFSHLVIGY
jgi:hypothetical protein